MKKLENKKKVWDKPVVRTLNIKKDTFSGSGIDAEKGTTSTTKYPNA